MKKNLLGIFLTDTHLSESNIEVIKLVFRQAIALALKNKMKVIYHLGDIFHSRKAQPQEILSVFDDILDEIHAAGLMLVVIAGNHDKSDYSSFKSFIKQYKHHPAIHLIQEAEAYSMDANHILHMLPFFEDEEYIRRLSELPDPVKGCKTILGTHIGFAGAVMNNGMPVDSSVTPNHVRDYDLVLVGHYHDPQELAEGKIKYIGASVQHNFGEGEVKGATLLYDDLTIETSEFDFPKYRTFQVNVNDVTNKDLEDIKEEKIETGAFIRIILTGKEKDIKSFNRQPLIDLGVKVEVKEDPITKEDIQTRVEPFDATSLVHEFGEFCEKDKINYDEGMTYLKAVL